MEHQNQCQVEGAQEGSRVRPRQPGGTCGPDHVKRDNHELQQLKMSSRMTRDGTSSSLVVTTQIAAQTNDFTAETSEGPKVTEHI